MMMMISAVSGPAAAAAPRGHFKQFDQLYSHIHIDVNVAPHATGIDA